MGLSDSDAHGRWRSAADTVAKHVREPVVDVGCQSGSFQWLQFESGNDFRSRDHAVHYGVDHPSVAGDRLASVDGTQERRGGGAKEDQRVHPVLDGRSLLCPKYGLRLVLLMGK